MTEKMRDSPTAAVLVGVDIGGTKTQIRVTSGEESRNEVIPTPEWLHGPNVADRESVARLVALAHDLAQSRSAPMVVGAHGCDSPRQIDELSAAIRHHHRGPVLVVNDASLVVPASGYSEGIAVIAGTGSIVVGVDSAGRTLNAGGHGWMLADPGSAPSITREAVRAILARYDRTNDPGSLGLRLLNQLESGDMHAFIERFTQTASMHMWGSFAPVIFAAAAEGESDALMVIDDEARRLIELVAAVVERGAIGEAIVATGGVVSNQALLADRLSHHARELLPTHNFEVLSVAPVAGAIELARTLPAEPTLY